MSRGRPTFGSLFAGIGGMDLGLERAGWSCSWQVEIDPYARRVLAKHWPEVPRLEDVRHVGAKQLALVDLIAGGFPCQDISHAGKKRGIEGERSGLWGEYARIIDELRPRFVLVENVAALLFRGMGRVLGDLAALGYDAEWDCLPAAAFGAPHRRDRLFLVAYADRQLRERFESRSKGQARGEAAGERALSPDSSPWGSRRSDMADTDRVRSRDGLRKARSPEPQPQGQGSSDRDAPDSHEQRCSWESQRHSSQIFRRPAPQRDDAVRRGSPWKTEPALGRVVDGFPGRVDQLRGLGNAVVPQVAEWIGRRILEVHDG